MDLFSYAVQSALKIISIAQLLPRRRIAHTRRSRRTHSDIRWFHRTNPSTPLYAPRIHRVHMPIASRGPGVAQAHPISHVAHICCSPHEHSGFPWGDFPSFPRDKLEVWGPFYQFLDYLEVILRVCGHFLLDGRPRNYLAGTAFIGTGSYCFVSLTSLCKNDYCEVVWRAAGESF